LEESRKSRQATLFLFDNLNRSSTSFVRCDIHGVQRPDKPEVDARRIERKISALISKRVSSYTLDTASRITLRRYRVVLRPCADERSYSCSKGPNDARTPSLFISNAAGRSRNSDQQVRRIILWRASATAGSAGSRQCAGGRGRN